MKSKNFLITALPILFIILNAKSQQIFPKSGEFSFVKGTKYMLAPDGPLLIFQTDGNFILKSPSGNYIWGLDKKGLKIGDINDIKFTNGNLVAKKTNGDILWSALTTGADPSNSLILTWSNSAQILNRDKTMVLWSSDGNLRLDEGKPPALLPAFAPSAAVPEKGSEIEVLQENCKKCKEGLDLLKANMYKYPQKPNIAPAGQRSWIDVFTEFQKNYLPGCNAVGKFLNDNKGKKVVASIEAYFSSSNVANWDYYFNSNVGIITHGSRIPPYCPGLHLNQYNCVEASKRMIEVSIPGVENVLQILKPLECMPENGYAHCRITGSGNVKIFGTDKVSVSAIENVDHIYTSILDQLQPEYPKSKFDGYKVYITNAESIAELDQLPPINTMWKTGEGEGTRDWLRGGTNYNFLWISEQMICKTGVATRNRNGIKDKEVRTFDQVVHEFAHAIDMRFKLKSREMEIYKTSKGSSFEGEDFPWGVQHWFGVPGGGLKYGEQTLFKKIFKQRQSFSCNFYTPK